MECASCRRDAADGRQATWIAGVETSRDEAFQTQDTIVLNVSYAHFRPIDVFLCAKCYAARRRGAQVLFWLFVALFLAAIGGFVFVAMLPAFNDANRTDAEAGLVAFIIVAAGAPLIGAAMQLPTLRVLGTDAELRRILGAFVEKKVRAARCHAWWTPEGHLKREKPIGVTKM